MGRGTLSRKTGPTLWCGHTEATHSSAGMDPEGGTDMYSGSTAGLEEVPPPLHLIWPISPAYGRSSLFHSPTQSPDWARWTRE